MNRMLALLGGGVLAAGLSVAAFAHDDKHKEGAEGKEVTLIGELVDTACFVASDGDAKGTEHAECATKCMSTGVPAGILPQKSKDAKGMLFLLTNPKPLAPHAAKTVKVVGTAHAAMHAFDVKKLYVQAAGGKWQEVKLDDEHHKMGGDDAEAGHGDHKEGHGDHGSGKAKGAAKDAAKGAAQGGAEHDHE